MEHKVQCKLGYGKDIWSGKSLVWPIESPTNDQIETCKKWCKEHIGSNGWNYYGKYRKIPCQFRFKQREDLLAFKLVFFGLLE